MSKRFDRFVVSSRLGPIHAETVYYPGDRLAWFVSPKLHAAIESEIADRVAEALRPQLPEDAPDEPEAWQGRGWEEMRSEAWHPKHRKWVSGSGHNTDLDAFLAASRLCDFLRWLCTEPEQLTMPMRARRELGRCLRNSREKFVGGLAGTEWAIRADALRDLLIDSGEPL